MIEVVRSLVQIIHRMLPKGNHVVVYGWPDFEDNSIALEQALQDTSIPRLILLVSDENLSPTWPIGPKTCLVRKSSPKGLWLFLRARYLFFTHPCFVRQFPKNVISVNIWHGMPIKRIGRMLEGSVVIESSHLLATSPFWSEIMEQSMSAHNLIKDSGLPRNDRLFCPRQETLSKLGFGMHRKLVTWLPTYRNSVMGELRQDGHQHNNPFELPHVNPDALNEFMAARGVMLITKPHPMACSIASKEWSNLVIINDAWLMKCDTSLYEMLGVSDILITDISSVMIDYLLLDRPIIHAFPDIEEYRNSRGFTVEPIEDYFAGEVVSNQEQLLAALELELAGQDPHAKKRRALRDLSHTHQDNKATERLLQAIGLKSGS